MTMKRRIFISNTLMVLISLLVLLAAGGVSLKLFKKEIMNLIEQNSELSDNTYYIWEILANQRDNPVEWTSLSDKLSEYGFDLYVSDANRNKIYSDLKFNEMECIEALEKGESDSDNIKIYSMERVTIARCTVNYDNNYYRVYAAAAPSVYTLWGIDRGLFERFLIVFFIAGIAVIAGLLACCLIFTKFRINKIMKPVDELNRAAKRINCGNLSVPVDYEENDEFKEVCNTFNEMQKNLLSGIEKNARYEKARTEMISGISHDLRTPLTSVKGFIKGLIDGVANTPQKQEQYLRISYQKACDMEVLLQKLFYFSKLETGNMPFFKQKTELNQWISGYVCEKTAESIAGNYKIITDLDDENCYVMADCEQLKRVFDNIIENSRKYSGVHDLQITISIMKDADNIYLTFADNGMGIDDDRLGHVFEQFYRGDESRNSETDGNGLGLYVCRYIVKHHDGKIMAYNKNGFVVEIILPEFKEEKKEGGENA